MKYEIMIILKPLLPEDIRGALQKKIESALTHKGGKILNEDVWGKRHLAYDINSHDEGYYIIYTFETNPSGIDKINADLNLANDVLRYMITKVD